MSATITTNHVNYARWSWLYYGLAAFCVLAVSVAFYVSHELQGCLSESIASHKGWSAKLNDYAELIDLASAVSSPANRVFQSRDIAAEEAAVVSAAATFFRQLERARRGLDGVDAAVAAPLLDNLAAAGAAIHNVVSATNQVFHDLRSQRLTVAAASMSAADHHYYEAIARLNDIRRNIRDVQAREFDAEAATAAWWGGFEYVLAGALAAMVIGLIVYGGTMSRRMAHDQMLVVEQSAALTHQNAELERATAAAKSAANAKSEFLANMSHELRTPLTAIMGYSELLFEESWGRKCQDTVQVIRRNCEHLLGLINDILDLSKIEAGKLLIERVACDPGRILAEVHSLMHARATAKGLKFELDFDGSIPEAIVTDPLRLRQILLNLVGNAIKFTENGGVRVTTRFETSDAKRLVFEVRDTGIGVSSELRDSLFQPFTQADASMSRRFGGSGLGLAISQRLAAMLDGRITVVSSPGRGSCFTLRIAAEVPADVALVNPGERQQLDESQADAAGPRSQPPPPAAQFTGRVLLAEDGEDNLRLISHLLRKHGLTPITAVNGEIAARLALAAIDKGTPFDLILMDMQMPVLDGYSATKLLRAKGLTGPIVALTAHAMSGDREKCLSAGCDDYETKPIDHARFVETLARWLPKVEPDAAGSPLLPSVTPSLPRG